MKPMPSLNGTNYAKLYIAGPAAAYDSVVGPNFDEGREPERMDWSHYARAKAREYLGMDTSSPDHDHGQGIT